MDAIGIAFHPGATARLCSGRLYTEKCGDSGERPSNLHDCHPISGRQHESAADGGNGGVPSFKLLGEQRFRAFFGRLDMILTGGCIHAPRALFCVLQAWRYSSGFKS